MGELDVVSLASTEKMLVMFTSVAFPCWMKKHARMMVCFLVILVKYIALSNDILLPPFFLL
jgi:hypothetical protein